MEISLKHFLSEIFLVSQFFLKVSVYTLMVFLTRMQFPQYPKISLVLKLGGTAEKWGLLFAEAW